MGKHDNKITVDGQGNLDISKTKDVREAGSGRQGRGTAGLVEAGEVSRDAGRPSSALSPALGPWRGR